MLFKGFPDGCEAMKSLRNGVLERGSSARWANEWEEHAKPLLSELLMMHLFLFFQVIFMSHK
ncbi:hypothetical protein MKX01_009500 [Papaver californicum]|nr:hypothetical protein MKX01_009500 [Papaver californicum]